VEAFLESLLIVVIVFRWIVLALGTGLIILLFYLQRHQQKKGVKWFVILIMLVLVIITGVAIYHILLMDFNLIQNAAWS
jgi:hypothetical protein